MAARYLYVVASAHEMAALDPDVGPVGSLPAERCAELPGIDPVLALPALAAVLAGDVMAARRVALAAPIRHAGLAPVEPALVEAIQGADGDPELEWDDVTARWADLLGMGGNSGRADLLDATTTLRALCGVVDDASALYCWSTGG